MLTRSVGAARSAAGLCARGYHVSWPPSPQSGTRPSPPPDAPWDAHYTRRVGLLGVKRGMMHTWDKWGVHIPLTVVEIVDNQVVQTKSPQTDKNFSLQVGAVNNPRRLPAAVVGHFKKYNCPPKRQVEEFVVTENAMLPSGTHLYAPHFVAGQKIDVTGLTAGKGFQGVMKRHGFKGQPASHGHSLSHRSRGSVGSSQQMARIRKGTRSAGHMGQTVTLIRGVVVYEIDTKLNVLMLRGQVPGKPGSYIKMRDMYRGGQKMWESLKTQPPFPTYVPDKANPLPDRITMSAPEVDPMTAKVTYFRAN